MTSRRKLWIGFGALTALLILFVAFLLLRLSAIEQAVFRQVEVAQPRKNAADELEVNLLSYVVNLRTALAGYPGLRAETQEAATKVTQNLAVYQALGETALQRELAARFAGQWHDLYTLGERLLDAGRAGPEEIAQILPLRRGLEGLLNEEMQADAAAIVSARQEASLRDVRTAFGYLLVLSASCVLLGLVVTLPVARGIVRTEQRLLESEERLQAILDAAGDAIITINGQGTIQAVNRGAEAIFGYPATELVGHHIKLLMPAPYRMEHDRYLADYLRTDVRHVLGIGREVLGQRKDGSTFPAELAVNEIPQLHLFTGIIRDITRRKELEREVVEIASLEQRRIGQDLHDSVSQELTALNLLVGDLVEIVPATSPTGLTIVKRLAEGLGRSQRELRSVLRGLLPVPIDTRGLMAALGDLAERTQQEGKAACHFHCPASVFVGDNLTATHLYFIAQEAVHNALKHARPQAICISLEEDHSLVLRVQDDGQGMDQPATGHAGLGLRIMRNRAAIIGATLTVGPAAPAGCLVTCTLPRKDS